MTAHDRIIVALDVPRVDEARALVKTLGDSVGVYKIGLELLFAGGIELARELVAQGRRVFLDAMTTARTLPFTPGLERWVVTVLKALDRVWLGELAPGPAMAGIEDDVNAILARSAERAAARP